MNLNINIPEYEVSQFNQLIKKVVETNFDYVRIRGEISELKSAASGHLYLTLKDDNSILNATIWSQKKNYLQIYPEVGMEVIVTGKISTYAKSISTYSINIDKIELAGEGALLKLIEDRKKKLKEKGFFDEEHKKEIPFFPKKIGVITSSTGSVIHDIINRIKDRFPIDIDVWPVAVQGTRASQEIINAIKGFNSDAYNEKPNTLIIARGGGSTEDLMPFNDEKLAIAVFNSKLPIISAIGHETDTTIVDYVSDLRASTPTAAAEKAVPMKNELEKNINHTSTLLNNIIINKLNSNKNEIVNLSKLLKAPSHIFKSYKEKFNSLNSILINKIENIYKNNNNKADYLIQLLRFPEKKINDKKNNLSYYIKNLETIVQNNLLIKKNEYNSYNRLLESNSLHQNLKKGYSVIRKSKKIINKSTSINKDDLLNIQFFDKSVKIKIKKVN